MDTLSYQELDNLIKNAWSDDFPVALFPVKMQIRFMNCLHIAQIQDTDSIADAQEVNAELSAATQQALSKLTERLNSGNQELPASILVPGHKVPAGNQAGFSTNGWVPKEDIQELWIRFYPDDVHLHTHEEPLTVDEFESGKDFWKEMNAAVQLEKETDTKNHRVGAWRVLSNGYGNARAAWIARTTRPANFDEHVFTPAEDLDFPDTPPDANTTTWNEAPQSKVLPEYFVVRTVRQSGQQTITKSFVGQPIPDTLQLSVDPNDSPDLFEETNKGLNVPEGMKWLVDFEEAEKVGMAIRIPISETEATQGFEKILAIGVKANKSDSEGQELMDELFRNHHYKPGGMSIIPQGTPSNNTDVANSGKGLEDLDAAESYELEFGSLSFEPTTDHANKRDGQRLAEALGMENEEWQSVYYNTGTDIASSIKMNQVLWNATLGYSLPQMLFPLIRQAEVDQCCRFMVNYAHCRGFLPALRIDDQPYGILPTTNFIDFSLEENDPFAAYINQLNQQVLLRLDEVWEDLVDEVVKIDKEISEQDFVEIFYKVLELHSGSVTYDQQLTLGEGIVDTLQTINNTNNILVDEARKAAIQNNFNQKFGVDLSASPIALTYLHASNSASLKRGNLVDSLPPDEDQTVEALEGTEKNYMEWLGDFSTTFSHLKDENFSNLPDANLATPPRSLLYNLMRYSLFRHYLLTAMNIKYRETLTLGEVFSLDFEENILWVTRDDTNPDIITGVTVNSKFQTILTDFLKKDKINEFRAAALELFPNEDQADQRAQFVEQQIANTDLEQFANERMQAIINVEGNVADLYANDKIEVLNFEITIGNTTQKIRDYLDAHINDETNEDTKSLRQHKLFLQDLADQSNAVLERLFNEHLDACHYRLDAWKSGLANYRLEQMRQNNRTGTYIGAYGYLENIRPKPGFAGICVKEVAEPETVVGGAAERISPVFPLGDITNNAFQNDILAERGFTYLGTGDPFDRIGYDEGAKEILPLPQEDPQNQGFIPTPSMVHAVTAAVLKNAHTSHQNTASADETFALNLSSSRIREARYFLEGLENGQDIGALLGYKFERLLRESQLTLTMYIYEFRDKYPYKVQNIDKPIGVDGSDELDSRVVVHGKKLLKDYRNGDLETFMNTLNPALNADQRAFILATAAKLDTTLDSINDLLMAESFFQIAAGNPDRSRAALKMLNDAGNVQLPQITDIPRTGFSLTHKVGIMLPSQGRIQEWGVMASLRSVGAPRINTYFKDKLPRPGKILVRVRWKIGETDTGEPIYQHRNVTVWKLLIQPIDLVYMYFEQKNSQTDSELRYRLDAHIRQLFDLEDEQLVEILEKDRTDFDADEVDLYSLSPLLLSLAEIVHSARYLRPDDFTPPAEGQVLEARQHFDVRRLATQLNAIFNQIKPKYVELVNMLDDLEAFAQLSEQEIKDQRATILSTLRKTRQSLLFFAGAGFRNALPTLDYTLNKANVEQLYLQARATHKQIGERLKVLLSLGILTKEDLQSGNPPTSRALKLDDVRDFVIKPLMNNVPSSHFKDLTNEQNVEELIQVIQALMGRAFPVFPTFNFFNQTAVTSAYEHDQLLDYAGDFAVEEWLQSLAPVRPKMHLYMKLQMLTEMFDTDGSDRFLKPIQLPFQEGGVDRWLGVEYPEEYEQIDTTTNLRKIQEDTLSLVFEYSDLFRANKDYAGLLIDEWNEIIPEKEVNTGLSFHYDQPNSEAPNAILLAVPAQKTGQWTLNDFFDTLEATFDLARKRAVDPDLIKTTFLNQFLPAVLAAINQKGHAPSLDFGRMLKAVDFGDDSLVLDKFAEPPQAVVTSLDIAELGLSDVFLDEDLDNG